MRKCNFDNSIVSLSNSILKRFGAKPIHKTSNFFDHKLANENRVILFLFDGLGKNIIEKHLSPKSFIRKNFVTTLDSTYPPTTVAATTALLSGRFPGETGWLGWSLYHKNLNRNVTCFTNQDDYTGEFISGPRIMETQYAYKNICTMINEANEKQIAFLNYMKPESSIGPRHIGKWFKNAAKLARSNKESFVYSYHNKPDDLIHEYGTDSKKVHRYIQKIDHLVKRFAKHHKDIALIIMADHGLIDVNYLNIHDHEDLANLLTSPIYLEKRSPAFNVKKGSENLFRDLFNKYYGEHFELYSKEQIEKENLFSNSSLSETAKKFLPDFLGVAKDNSCLTDKSNGHPCKGHHGGASKEEYEINIAFIHSNEN